jgi:hypothetical protein
MNSHVFQTTRIGNVVNLIRKASSETHPLLSQECRALVKAWANLHATQQQRQLASSALSPGLCVFSPFYFT